MPETLPKRTVKSAVACVIVVVTVTLTVARTDSLSMEHRSDVADALLQYRLRELGWLTSREACLAHALTLEPLDRRAAGVARCYVGLTELHAGDTETARASFERGLTLLSDTASGAEPAEIDALRLCQLWLQQLDSPPDPDDLQALLLTPDNRPARPVVEITVELQREPSPSDETDRNTILNYQLVDPATITEQTSEAITQLPQTGTTVDEWLRVAWRGLLTGDDDLTTTALSAVRELANSTSLSTSEQLELAGLQFAASDGAVAAFPEKGSSDVPLPLWALRALSVSSGQTLPLDEARSWLREMIGDADPFDPRLLFPPRGSPQEAKCRYLRNCYHAVGHLYAVRGVETSGFWMQEPPVLDERRAARLLSELNSPLRTHPTEKTAPLHAVEWACACVRSGDYESWQSISLEEQTLWPQIITWTRIVAGDRRTRSPGLLASRDDESAIQPPDMLLVGTGDSLDLPSLADVDAPKPTLPLLGDIAEQTDQPRAGRQGRLKSGIAVALVCAAVLMLAIFARRHTQT